MVKKPEFKISFGKAIFIAEHRAINIEHRISNTEYRNGLWAKTPSKHALILMMLSPAPTSKFGVRNSVFDISFIPCFPLSKLSKTFVCRKKNQKFLRPCDFRPESPIQPIPNHPNPPINKSPFHDPFRTRCR
jgi:hypothetical protein